MFILILFLSVYLIGCSSGVKEDIPKKSIETPDQELWDTKVNFSEGELKRATLEARYIAKFEDKKITRAKGLKLTFVDSLNSPYGILFADSGVVHDETGKIEFYGYVKFFTMENETLWTTYLMWDPSDELIKTREKVKLARGGEIIEANGMETDIRMDKIRFLGGVKGKAREEH